MNEDLAGLAREAEEDVASCRDAVDLERVRVAWLGKKGRLTAQLRAIGELPAAQRPEAGAVVHRIRGVLEEALTARAAVLREEALAASEAAPQEDITRPGRRRYRGSLHPLTQTMERLEECFAAFGYEKALGPEIETEYYNFEALNIPARHPARAMHDTFYLQGERLLRTHTSPVQVRVLEQREPPLRMIFPGKAYRRDSDLTHTPMFHQMEGLVVDDHTSFAELRYTLRVFLQLFFEQDVELRFRPSYFPFTEPSAEVDIACVMCAGEGCRVCRGSGWLEVLGCGMVHPQVLRHCKVDTERWRGFAFGVGIERLAMLRYGIDDIRLFFENDLRFLRQFS